MESRESFDAVAKWLYEGNDPKVSDIAPIRPHLQDIYERLMRVRAISPTVDLTERMWVMMERAGFKVKKALLRCRRSIDLGME